ncbi:mitotic spindle assembly checkpoint protein-like protein MAD1 [Delitschia confertaspora ATCC 74209]|uniref:Spindle assembly checkpoint component MAD1 n=1 Tax=Delitschia confertaspora ATCC 74209 TaxID=1513339 RepID=A0A9P4JR89_9PLEO|nr:mitotic spindle assembly checkpoint protein-like protein MAD1 [Delitschia confertaspora ATCC 74209]
MANRHQVLPTYDFLTGGDDATPDPPLRQTLRASHAVRPEPANEDLRAQINTLHYELETLKQEREVERLQHQQELQEMQNRAEGDFRRAQAAESANKSTALKYDTLSRELQEIHTRTANERQDLESRLRRSQEKAQQLQEEADEAKEDMALAQREHDHKYNGLQSEYKALKESVTEIRTDLEAKINALQTTQRKLSQKESEVGELESEVLRLKAKTGDADTLAVIKRELTEQVTHIKKLEAINREQHAELKQFRDQHKAIEIVEEQKRTLETKLRLMGDMERELNEAQLRRQALEDERASWTSYLESQTNPENELQFSSPEDLARAFVQERLETAELLKKLGAIQPELSVKEENIRVLEDEKAKLQAEILTLKTSGAGVNSGAGDSKVRARLERQKALVTKEVEFLREQLKAFDIEESEMQPENHDVAKSARIKELEDLVDQYRKEVDEVQKELAAAQTQSPLTVAAGVKRPLDSDEVDERLGELRRKNKQLQEELKEMQKAKAILEADYKAQHSQLKSLKASSRTRILELRSNPTADAEALKLSTVKTLREANAELLARLQGQSPAPTSVPLATLNSAEDKIAELEHTVAEREKRIKRLKQIWTAKSLEFREAVASVLGWKIDFLPNGRARVTSMFYPGDEETGENSILFDGENGTMKVSGGPQSAFASEIKDNITFWVEERKEIPCFLAALTLEFWERGKGNEMR